MLHQLKTSLRPLARWVWIAFLFSTGLLRWAKWRLGRKGGIVVLTLHRVLSSGAFPRTNSLPGMVVREETFEDLARFVSRHYEMVSLADGVPRWGSANRKPRIAFTFDDGWIDNAQTAFPIAQRYGTPFTVFVCPGQLGVEAPFWPEQVAALSRIAERFGGLAGKLRDLMKNGPHEAQLVKVLDGKKSLEGFVEFLKSLPEDERNPIIDQLRSVLGVETAAGGSGAIDTTMSWEDVTALAKEGVTFGSHTQSHQILPLLSASDVDREIIDSKRALQEILGEECLVFSYPNGDWSPEVRDQVKKAGYKLAFVNHPGVWDRNCDSWLIPRVNIWEGKLVGLSGRFSRVAFEYSAFWKACCQGNVGSSD